MMITHHEKYEFDPTNYGYQERLRHIQLIREGAKAYLVMCRVKDPKSEPREIAGWNEKEVFVGGALSERNGDTWIAVDDRIPIRSILIPSK